MKARLIATGERAPSWVAEGFAEYRKRLSYWLPLELVEVEPGLRGKGRDPQRATEDEGRRVLAALPKNAHVVALDVPGRAWSSEQLAQRIAPEASVGAVVDQIRDLNELKTTDVDAGKTLIAPVG